MITSVNLADFKNFCDSTLTLGNLTVIIGTNASGKSNIRDAFRFLHGIGRGYTIAEILGGKWGSGGQLEWSPLRGALSEVFRFGEKSFSFFVEANIATHKFEYFFWIEMEDARKKTCVVIGEYLFIDGLIVYFFDQDNIVGVYCFQDPSLIPEGMRQRRGSPNYQVTDVHTLQEIILDKNIFMATDDRQEDDELFLSSFGTKNELKNDKISESKILKDFLSGFRFLDPSPDAIRRPSFPGQTVLGERGENLATVLQAICADPGGKQALLGWLRELTPADIVDLDFVGFPNGAIQLALVEPGGKRVSAESASDGTLRFLAILGALLSPNPPKLIFFEEVDQGIHPSRQWVLVDLLQTETRRRGIQVVTTTHSPDFLTMVDDETMKTTSVVFRPPGKDYAVIKPIVELPNIHELRKTQGLGRLISSRWFEDALTLMQEDGEDGDNGDGGSGDGGSGDGGSADPPKPAPEGGARDEAAE